MSYLSTYTQEELAQARKAGDFILLATSVKRDESKEGVAFKDWLVSIDGAGFALFRESHHTDEDIARAKRWLRDNRDVVTIQVYLPEKRKP